VKVAALNKDRRSTGYAEVHNLEENNLVDLKASGLILMNLNQEACTRSVH
jgi:hypothetical protein